jgi:murein DD-endopeptidase MepM/ murein hydrolase activator NlpD
MSRKSPSRTQARTRFRWRRRWPARAGAAVLVVAVMLAVGSVPASTAVSEPEPETVERLEPAAMPGPEPVVVKRAVRAPVVLAPGHPSPAVVASPAAILARTPASSPDAAAGTARWMWPAGPPHDLVRPFQAPASRYGAGHRGIDIVAGPGDPVLAPADGVVSFTGVVVDRGVLSIQHDENLVSSFEPVVATVSEGERVSAGQVVGVVASGAHCSDRCLHFGVRRHGQYISPVLFLGGLSRAVLLPLPPAGPVLHPAP